MSEDVEQRQQGGAEPGGAGRRHRPAHLDRVEYYQSASGAAAYNEMLRAALARLTARADMLAVGAAPQRRHRQQRQHFALPAARRQVSGGCLLRLL